MSRMLDTIQPHFLPFSAPDFSTGLHFFFLFCDIYHLLIYYIIYLVIIVFIAYKLPTANNCKFHKGINICLIHYNIPNAWNSAWYRVIAQ